jgi:hypothetical protein
MHMYVQVIGFITWASRISSLFLTCHVSPHSPWFDLHTDCIFNKTACSLQILVIWRPNLRIRSAILLNLTVTQGTAFLNGNIIPLHPCKSDKRLVWPERTTRVFLLLLLLSLSTTAISDGCWLISLFCNSYSRRIHCHLLHKSSQLFSWRFIQSVIGFVQFFLSYRMHSSFSPSVCNRVCCSKSFH